MRYSHHRPLTCSLVAFCFAACSKPVETETVPPPPIQRQSVADPGPGMVRLKESMLAMQAKMSFGLGVYLDTERKWDESGAWLLVLSMDNLSPGPISIPMAALNEKHAIITTQREGEPEPIPYIGTHTPIEDSSIAGEGSLQIPAGASLAFALSLPQGHPFQHGIKPGTYLFSWPFHPEAKCRIVLSDSGTIKTLE